MSIFVNEKDITSVYRVDYDPVTFATRLQNRDYAPVGSRDKRRHVERDNLYAWIHPLMLSAMSVTTQKDACYLRNQYASAADIKAANELLSCIMFCCDTERLFDDLCDASGLPTGAMMRATFLDQPVLKSIADAIIEDSDNGDVAITPNVAGADINDETLRQLLTNPHSIARLAQIGISVVVGSEVIRGRFDGYVLSTAREAVEQLLIKSCVVNL